MRTRTRQVLRVVLDLGSAALMFAAPIASSALFVLALSAASSAWRIDIRVLLAIAPALYFAWLLLFFAVSAIEMRLLGAIYRKPEVRTDTFEPGLKAALRWAALEHIYRREVFVLSLPGMAALLITPAVLSPLKRLAMRAYAPAVHIGRNDALRIWLQDPELTRIGDSVVVGAGSDITCHVFTSMPGHRAVYQAARVTIRSRATIGGGCRIAMGVTIDEDAIVEGGSSVPPFTTIGAGEVWGGSPAAFLRMRDAFEGRNASSTPQPVATLAVVNPELRATVKMMVARAIRSTAEDAPDDMQADARWDSLARLSIAAALYDRFGIRVNAAESATLTSVDAIARLVAATRADDEHAPDDPELLPLLEPAAATRALARRFQDRVETPGLKVTIAATFTAQQIASPLELWCHAFGIPVDIAFHGFDQVEQALLSRDAGLQAGGGRVNVVLLRGEDLITAADPAGEVRARNLLDAIDDCRSRGGALIVSGIPPALSPLFRGDRSAAARLAAWWMEQIRNRPEIQFLDIAAVQEDVGRERALDTSSELAALAPYSPVMFQRLAIAIARLIRARFLPPKKVLAVDCDGTLWGGVVGEDGIDGIALGPDHPGRSFRALQERIVDLRRRGVLIALVSKNEEADVWNVFEHHTGMALRRSDVAAHRINWREKSANLRELAAELNVGLDSVVLLDDARAEREEAAMNAPEVTVVPLSDDPARYVECLSLLWCFDGAGTTAEDASRTEAVAAEADRRALRRDAGSLEKYLESLQVSAGVRPAADRDLPRVAQLTQKTNQFNLSLVRRSLDEIQALRSSRSILVLDATDRFGDYGIVGAAIVDLSPEGLALDTFLISCRALGRGLEDAFLFAVIDLGRASGCPRVVAPFRQGARNHQVRDFFQRSGFADDDGVMTLPLRSAPLAPPKHIKLSVASLTSG